MNKILRLLAATFVYLVLTGLVWMAFVHLVRVNVVFYSALGAAMVAALLHTVLCLATPMLRGFRGFEVFQHLVSCMLIGYILAISVPTVLDRSLSFYILEKLQQRGGGIRLSHFEQVFTEEYMREHRLVDVRLTEQAESGTISIEGDCVRLTPKGDRLASFSRYFRQQWLPRKRLLRDEYTHVLTDPFAHGVQPSVDYTCQ